MTFSISYDIILKNPFLRKRAEALSLNPYVRISIKISTQPTREIISIISLLSCCTNLVSFFILFSIGITPFLYILYHTLRGLSISFLKFFQFFWIFFRHKKRIGENLSFSYYLFILEFIHHQFKKIYRAFTKPQIPILHRPSWNIEVLCKFGLIHSW